jgi:hypothetical protein
MARSEKNGHDALIPASKMSPLLSNQRQPLARAA